MLEMIKMLGIFLRDTFRSHELIRSMVINDFRSKYASSVLGIFWAFVQPTVQIAVLWFVFSVGFRSGPTDTGVPFSLWLVCGLVPWNFLSESVSSGTNCLIEYNYLVKKVVFRTSILPIVKILSALIVHGVFLIFLISMSVIYGYYPTLHTLQIIYYLICILLLSLGTTWITSALAAFFKDTSQLVNVILQLMIWLTPILWSSNMLSPKMLMIFKLNPVFYIVQGYRDAFTGEQWFWEKPIWTTYFFLLTALLLAVGALIFHKLRKHFSDVL